MGEGRGRLRDGLVQKEVQRREGVATSYYDGWKGLTRFDGVFRAWERGLGGKHRQFVGVIQTGTGGWVQVIRAGETVGYKSRVSSTAGTKKSSIMEETLGSLNQALRCGMGGGGGHT